MSSIYKKGRDGYYYYQTYVYNQDTGKKDKRIFHSLGTRDLTEAEKKRSELDNKYKIEENSKNQKITSFLSSNVKSFSLVALSIFLTIFFSISFQKTRLKKNVEKKDNYFLINEKNIRKKKTQEESIPAGIKFKNSRVDSIKVIKQKTKTNITIPVLPDYKVVRIDRLSSSFEQGKIYVTVNNNPSVASLELLCKKLTDSHKEFSNIIICIYDSSPIGQELANGINTNYSVEEQKKAWLAMYSYNPVEGHYFDDNPGGYLGAF